ncbi:MAG: DUF6726 family protein [Janthinobacterium lividum]
MNTVLRFGMWVAVAGAFQLISGCGVAALPCRLTSATLKIVPLVGHAAALPFDACSAAID